VDCAAKTDMANRVKSDSAG